MEEVLSLNIDLNVESGIDEKHIKMDLVSFVQYQLAESIAGEIEHFNDKEFFIDSIDIEVDANSLFDYKQKTLEVVKREIHSVLNSYHFEAKDDKMDLHQEANTKIEAKESIREMSDIDRLFYFSVYGIVGWFEKENWIKKIQDKPSLLINLVALYEQKKINFMLFFLFLQKHNLERLFFKTIAADSPFFSVIQSNTFHKEKLNGIFQKIYIEKYSLEESLLNLILNDTNAFDRTTRNQVFGKLLYFNTKWSKGSLSIIIDYYKTLKKEGLNTSYYDDPILEYINNYPINEIKIGISELIYFKLKKKKTIDDLLIDFGVENEQIIQILVLLGSNVTPIEFARLLKEVKNTQLQKFSFVFDSGPLSKTSLLLLVKSFEVIKNNRHLFNGSTNEMKNIFVDQLMEQFIVLKNRVIDNPHKANKLITKNTWTDLIKVYEGITAKTFTDLIIETLSIDEGIFFCLHYNEEVFELDTQKIKSAFFTDEKNILKVLHSISNKLGYSISETIERYKSFIHLYFKSSVFSETTLQLFSGNDHQVLVDELNNKWYTFDQRCHFKVEGNDTIIVTIDNKEFSYKFLEIKSLVDFLQLLLDFQHHKKVHLLEKRITTSSSFTQNLLRGIYECLIDKEIKSLPPKITLFKVDIRVNKENDKVILQNITSGKSIHFDLVENIAEVFSFIGRLSIYIKQTSSEEALINDILSLTQSFDSGNKIKADEVLSWFTSQIDELSIDRLINEKKFEIKLEESVITISYSNQNVKLVNKSNGFFVKYDIKSDAEIVTKLFVIFNHYLKFKNKRELVTALKDLSSVSSAIDQFIPNSIGKESQLEREIIVDLIINDYPECITDHQVQKLVKHYKSSPLNHLRETNKFSIRQINKLFSFLSPQYKKYYKSKIEKLDKVLNSGFASKFSIVLLSKYIKRIQNILFTGKNDNYTLQSIKVAIVEILPNINFSHRTILKQTGEILDININNENDIVLSELSPQQQKYYKSKIEKLDKALNSAFASKSSIVLISKYIKRIQDILFKRKNDRYVLQSIKVAIVEIFPDKNFSHRAILKQTSEILALKIDNEKEIVLSELSPEQEQYYKSKIEKLDKALNSGFASKFSIVLLSKYIKRIQNILFTGKNDSYTLQSIKEAIVEILPNINFSHRAILKQTSEILDINIINEKDIELSEINNVNVSKTIKNCAIKIPNAGLVIITPYLQLFFSRQDLLKENNKEFKNEESLLKAIALLLYIGHKNVLVEDESQLILPKILCGLKVEESIAIDFSLTEEEKESADFLLETIIQHWSALKQMEPDSLRVMFFIRDGLLTLNEDWNLDVEKGTYDIFVKMLPWSIKLNMLPWMGNRLYCKWGK